MNKDRRAELFDAVDLLEEAIERINEIRDEEEEALYSLPDSLQESSRGFAMQDAMDTLDGFADDIGEISNKIAEYASPKKKTKK